MAYSACHTLIRTTPAVRSTVFVMTHKTRPRQPDDALFAGQPEPIQRLHKQAKRELRLKARDKWAREHGLK